MDDRDGSDSAGTVLGALGWDGGNDGSPPPTLYVMCRRGNDSQIAVSKLLEVGVAGVYDIQGGLQAWAQQIDPSFPIY